MSTENPDIYSFAESRILLEQMASDLPEDSREAQLLRIFLKLAPDSMDAGVYGKTVGEAIIQYQEQKMRESAWDDPIFEGNIFDYEQKVLAFLEPGIQANFRQMHDACVNSSYRRTMRRIMG